METYKTLTELTGQESGIVIYRNNGSSDLVFIINWDNCRGLPASSSVGLMSFDEDIVVEEEYETEDVASLLEDDAEYILDDIQDLELIRNKKVHAKVYQLSDDVIVCAPDDWN